jgi:hypothetical protein
LSKGSPAAADESAGLSSWIEFRRRELVRQRDLLRGVWRWYLGPLVPGMVVVLSVVFAHASHVRNKPVMLMLLVYMCVCGAVFVGIGRLNERGAQKLQRQVDELDEQGQG